METDNNDEHFPAQTQHEMYGRKIFPLRNNAYPDLSLLKQIESGVATMPARDEIIIYEDDIKRENRKTSFKIPVEDGGFGCAILDNRRVLLGEL